jgi:hypothetical protein
VKKHGLTTNSVQLSHLDQLVKFDEKGLCDLKLAPQLNSALLDPKHFDKMDVGSALKVLSPAVSHGLKFMVEHAGYSTDLLTTAIFIDTMVNWYRLISSRHPVNALSNKIESKHREAIDFLQSVIDLFQDIEIGPKWTQIQTGIILTTLNIIAIQDELLNIYGFFFFLTSRLTQDSLENLFSVIRSKNPVPSPFQFKYNLRMICMSQFMREHKNSNYEYDERTFLVDFLDTKKKKTQNEEEKDQYPEPEPDFFPDLDPDTIVQKSKEIDYVETNVLYYFSGHTLQSVMKMNLKTCPTCLTPALATDFTCPDVQALQLIKDFTGESLVKCSVDFFKSFFVPAEAFFKLAMETKFKVSDKGIVKCMIDTFFVDRDNFLPNCHNLDRIIAKRFFEIRIQHYARRIANERQKKRTGSERGSKSTEGYCHTRNIS